MIANPIYGGAYAYGKTGVTVHYDGWMPGQMPRCRLSRIPSITPTSTSSSSATRQRRARARAWTACATNWAG
jgi:hypothetical protein